MNWRTWNKYRLMRAQLLLRLYMRVAGIALLLGVASLTAYAAAIPGRSEISVNTSGNASQLTNAKRPHFSNPSSSQIEAQPSSSKWIRLCREGWECSSADDDIKRRSTFKA
ncbi:MAG TPA: hypothetical protein VIE69_05050 [Methylophilaceae bacterium]|jgi:hypothetical protein